MGIKHPDGLNHHVDRNHHHDGRKNPPGDDPEKDVVVAKELEMAPESTQREKEQGQGTAEEAHQGMPA